MAPNQLVEWGALSHFLVTDKNMKFSERAEIWAAIWKFRHRVQPFLRRVLSLPVTRSSLIFRISKHLEEYSTFTLICWIHFIAAS